MTTLTEDEIRTLHEALDDEYHSWATYDWVIWASPNNPNTFDRYDLTIRGNKWSDGRLRMSPSGRCKVD